MKIPEIFELECQAMHYDWGKLGNTSLVAQLLLDQTIDPNLPYAELWMGIHPKGPSKAKLNDGILLSKILKTYPYLLGNYSQQRWGTLPFLFKALSIATPLSIQMHPNKSGAETLHQKDALHYPDDNHKPEMALALSKMDALYGFEPKPALLLLFQRYPFLKKWIPQSIWERLNSPQGFQVALKEMVAVLLHLPQDQGEWLLLRIYTQIQQELQRTPKEELFFLLYPQFSQDLGLLFLFFMQKISIPPQAALSLKANELHAYLQGDLIECMANSDNVVRAGITHKFKDVDVLLSHVLYQTQPPRLIAGIMESDYFQKYSTDTEEFEITLFQLPASHCFYQETMGSPAILLILSGNGELTTTEAKFELKKGRVLFIGAPSSYHLKATKPLQAVRASVPLPQI